MKYLIELCLLFNLLQLCWSLLDVSSTIHLIADYQRLAVCGCNFAYTQQACNDSSECTFQDSDQTCQPGTSNSSIDKSFDDIKTINDEFINNQTETIDGQIPQNSTNNNDSGNPPSSDNNSSQDNSTNTPQNTCDSITDSQQCFLSYDGTNPCAWINDTCSSSSCGNIDTPDTCWSMPSCTYTICDPNSTDCTPGCSSCMKSYLTKSGKQVGIYLILLSQIIYSVLI